MASILSSGLFEVYRFLIVSWNAAFNPVNLSESTPSNLRVFSWVFTPNAERIFLAISADCAPFDPRNGVPKNIMPWVYRAMTEALSPEARLAPITMTSAQTSPPRLCATNINGRSVSTPISQNYEFEGFGGGSLSLSGTAERPVLRICAQVFRIMFELSMRDARLIPVSDRRVVSKEVNAAALNVF